MENNLRRISRKSLRGRKRSIRNMGEYKKRRKEDCYEANNIKKETDA